MAITFAMVERRHRFCSSVLAIHQLVTVFDIKKWRGMKILRSTIVRELSEISDTVGARQSQILRILSADRIFAQLVPANLDRHAFEPLRSAAPNRS